MTTIYLCMFRNEQGEKIAERVTARVPKVGEIIRISYVDAQGEFEVLKELHRTVMPDYEIVILQVRQVTPTESVETVPTHSVSKTQDSGIGKRKHIKSIVEIAKEILETANSSLIENEEVLLPLFQDESQVKAVYMNMLKLYQKQRNRGDFGRWKAFLIEAASQENEQELGSILQDLLLNIDKLYEAFYSTKYSGNYPSKKIMLNKFALANVLIDKGEKFDHQARNEMANWYLEHIRGIVEDMGRLVGMLSVKAKRG